MNLYEKIINKKEKIAVIGLGADAKLNMYQ